MRSILIAALTALSWALPASARAFGGETNLKIKPYKRELLQDIVTWDEHSLFVNGERILLYSGEFHPFRLPVPSLWLDVFQKIRSLGYTGVSFYIDWALLEGKPGDFSAEGVFAFEPFFDAAQKAGIYLLARPGPYINAEVSGGGFPGWLQRIQGKLRTNATDYLHATDLYVSSIGKIIAKAQITNGGPVILLQPENEYTVAAKNILFPDTQYMEYVEKQYRDAGIIVPFISNDASPKGHNAPGQPAPVDIYGHDAYPLRFDCANPTTWPDGALPTNWKTLHLQQSPLTPYSLVEFQGGSFDPWGGLGFEKCAHLLNHEFQRVFYKNDFSFGATVFNLYMTYGGTNWGNLGHPGGYTSYDYGSVITEDLLVHREKYSDAKLEANFLVASPAYLTAVPGNLSTTLYSTSADIAVTPLKSNQTQFWVVRHNKYNSLASTNYKLTLKGTSAGDLTIPQLSGSLTLNGRDSKIHVSDYDLGGVNLLYSSAEIFTWQKYSSKTVLVVYGGPGEQHEVAVSITSKPTVSSPAGLNATVTNSSVIVNWQTQDEDRVVKINDLYIYITARNSAYNYWVIPTPGQNGSLYTKTESSHVVLKAGYLIRTASVTNNSITLTGDLNATTSLQIIGGAPDNTQKLTFNGKDVLYKQHDSAIFADLTYDQAEPVLPVLTQQKWYEIDTLPEIQAGYSDVAWTSALNTTTPNTYRKLTTPTSLYSSDYGYHTGTLLYRGTFTASGNESTIALQTQGGSAFGTSAWINGTFIGSFAGYDAATNGNSTFTLPNLSAGKTYVITVVIDNQGLDEDYDAGGDDMKAPRGILNYNLAGHPQSDITWKLTGNLGGETYADRTRGPLNEGGLFAERQGFHLPSPPVNSTGWSTSQGPTAGLTKAGITFYATSFDLSIPTGYDIPISIQFTNGSASTNGSLASAYRAQVYVNGWQFGKYVNNVGPQTSFPVPEGIWNFKGTNWLAVSLWSLEAKGAKVADLKLVAGPVIQTGRDEVKLVDSPAWKQREGAY